MSDDRSKRRGLAELGLDRRQFLAGAAGTAMGALEITFPAGSALAAKFPDKPLTLVVMYAAGGGTDVSMRAIGQAMAAAKGWTINVINKPGAVGGIATKYVAEQPADGYTILGGANYNKFVRVMGHSTLVPWKEWTFFQAGASLASWSVRPDSPFKTFQDVVKAAKEKPGKISISTSGTGGIWHELALIVGDAAGIELKYVPYKGGKPATLAGLQGEVDIAGGGVHEHIDLIRAGKLRNLQQTGPEDIDVPGYGKMISIGNILPQLKPLLPVGGTYNFIMRRDTPVEILKEVKEAFLTAVKSDSFQAIVKKNYFLNDVRTGEAADRRAAQLEVVTAATFNKYKDQIGAPVKSAKDLGLPAPADFDKWWPPKDYKPQKF
jgi:tripartite-type tricarboxylate transporter receptor subunit TctC